MSDPTTLVVAQHSLVPLGSLLGPWLIGLVISAVVFGVTCLQVYLYYTKFCHRDTVFLKTFVGVLTAIDLFNLVLIAASYYVTSINNFGDFEAISRVPWSLRAQIIVGHSLSTLVQMFYAFRIWTLSAKSIYVPLCIITLSLGQLGFATGTTFEFSKHTAFADTAVTIPFSTSSLAFEVACDSLISMAMIYWLGRNKTGFHKTNRALNTLISYTVNSGLLIVIFAIACLVTFLTSKTTLIYGLFFFILVRLYACSFMSILNSREHVREQFHAANPDHAMVSIPTYPSRQMESPKDVDDPGLSAFERGGKRSQV
ncbi:hypothetical protein C8R46DRAFT_94176 [Mycena filopes]|nr:hypothetical protein C8R46DRAFT_295750 [Mycena filopes]KAJ7174822.1 hypothetical protein C8R46DRAFT_94176 [Mycena filopes]